MRRRLLTVRFMVIAAIALLAVGVFGTAVFNKNGVFAATCPCNVFTTTPGTFNQPGESS